MKGKYMKILLFILVLVASPLFAGVTGGTGPRGLVLEDLTKLGIDLDAINTQGDLLNLKPEIVSLNDYRRARARLSVPSNEAVMLNLSGKDVKLKTLDKLLSDQQETIYLIPETQN